MKKLILSLAAALLLFALPGWAEEGITSPEQLNAPGIVIGVSQGSAAELIVASELPQAGLAHFTDNNTAYLAVAQGKIDAFVFDLNQMRLAIEQGVTGVHLLKETLGEPVQVAVGLSPKSQIDDLEGKINRFIAELRADGTLEDMFSRWVLTGERSMPDIAAPQNPSLHLTVGTSGVVFPYSYYEGDQLSGYDIELARRFAAWLGADVEFKVYDYGAIIPAALTGDVDCIMANLNITAERREMLTFSDLLYEEKLGVMVRGEEHVPAWAAYNGKRIGVLVGGITETVANTYLPNSEHVYLTSYPDCVAALLAGKIDAYLVDEPEVKSVHAEQPRIDYIRERFTNQEYSFAFRKNDPQSAALCEELNAFLAQCRQDGTIQELEDIWFGADEARKVVDMSGLTGENGTIRVITTSTDMPFSYIKDGKNVGYDIDLVVRFCRSAGYRLELGDADFAARIPAVQSGKYDFSTDMNVTPERQEEVLFSDPTSSGGIVLAILADGAEQDQAVSEAAPSLAISQLTGRRIGVQTGTISGEVASALIPGITLSYFNTQTDILSALRAGKIYAWCTDEPILRYVSIENPDLQLLPDTLDTSSLAAVFPMTEEGQALRDQYSAFVEQLWADGTMAEIDSAWFSGDESRYTVLDYASLPDTNGTLRMALDSSILPFAFVKNGRVVGYDVDIAVRFCQANGYRLQVMPMDFNGVLSSLQSGKADFAACGITVTAERSESMLFSSPTYHSGTSVAILSKSASQADGYTALSQLSDARIGVQTGTTFDQIVLDTFPSAQISYFNSYPDMAAALQAHKIDAFPGDEPVLQLMAAENDRLTILSERMDSFDFGFVLPKTADGEKLMAELNAWIAQMEASGEMEQIRQKWITGADADKTVPDYAAFPATNGTLTLATEGAYAPMNYYRDNQVVGMEIDLAARFCQAYGYGLSVSAMSFDAILPTVQAGKADFAAAGITIAEERKESVYFSDPYYTGGTVMAVLKTEASAASSALAPGVYTTLSQLNGKHIGVQTGSSFAEAVTQRLPEAQVDYYIGKADLMAALTGHKVEAFVVDEPVAQIVLREDSRLTYLPEYLENYEFALVFPKTAAGEALRDQFNAFLKKLEADGRLDALALKWFGEDEAQKTMPDISALSAENGTLRLATESGYAPFEYMRDGQVVGYDMELAILFCQEYGYGLEIVDMNFDGILPAIQTGKCDFAAAGIGITPERAESVLFSAPNFTSGTVAVVLKDTSVPDARPSAGNGERADAPTFWDDLSDSFNKTFLRENRWKLFLEGIGTTTLITLLSILFGTALGFGIFMLCRNGNPIANGTTRFSMWLVQGTPMVVLLMILYYIIFGSVAISGVAVAVIGFTLTFGAAVFGLIRMGVGTIDRGQYEAAYALGHSNRHTFFKIILPQAIPHVLPAYQGEIVGLIKATAIVGYIAVQDLTKMGDIVRSRTYEAFFPLIAVTVIYFVLEGLFSFAVGRIRISLDPKKRKRDHILRGVNTHD